MEVDAPNLNGVREIPCDFEGAIVPMLLDQFVRLETATSQQGRSSANILLQDIRRCHNVNLHVRCRIP